MTEPEGPRVPADAPSDAQPVSEHDRALDAALARLDSLDATGVHEHVEVYTAVDRALRERLAGTES